MKPLLLSIICFLFCSTGAFANNHLKNVTAFKDGTDMKLDVTASIYAWIQYWYFVEFAGHDTITTGDTLNVKLYYNDPIVIGSGFSSDFLYTDTINIGTLNSNYKIVVVEMYTIEQLDTTNTDTFYHPLPWTIFLPLSITNTENKKTEFSIYPNPNNGKFIIEASNPEKEPISFDIINTLGQVIYRDNIVSTNGIMRKEIDLGDKPKGVYMLRMYAENGICIERLTVR